MKSYYDDLTSTKKYGTTPKLTQKPVFRSSAIFPVIHGSITTKILYLGYWLIKRQIPEVTILSTLRKDDGVIIKRNTTTVNVTKAFSIELKELLDNPNQNFQGSLELEVFSPMDMIFPFPAFVLCYYNNESSTMVHTIGRIYNDIEDLRENEDRRVPEAGFDIYSDNLYRSFFAFTNGPIINQNAKIDYELINHESIKLNGTFELGVILAYQTKFVNFDEHITGLSKFLQNKAGTIKITHNLKGFFPRFLAGTLKKNIQSYSFTHTYYDCTTCATDDDYWNNNNENFNDSSILIPLFIKDDYYTDLVLYPTFSPSNFSLILDFYKNTGELLRRITDYVTINSEDQLFTKLNFSKILDENNIYLEDAVTVNVIADWKGGKVPTRLKMGLNVGIKNKPIDLPCNICFAPNLGNPVNETKPGTFHWAPILNKKNSVLFITNSGPLKIYEKNANCKFIFYRELDDSKIQRDIFIPANGSVKIELDRDSELKSFLSNKSGWFAVSADNPYVHGWYFELNSTSGSVAGDHFF